MSAKIQFLEAAGRTVTLDRLDSPYFQKRFAGGRRVATVATVVPLLVPASEMGMP